MSTFLLKLGYRLPALLARAAAGDPTAVAVLAAAGVLSVI